MEATAEEVDQAVQAARAAAPALADRAVRAAFLRGAAGLLDEAKDHLVEAADAETALGPVRLTGELARTCFQLRAFADIVDEGAFLGVVIDHPDASASVLRRAAARHGIPEGVVGLVHGFDAGVELVGHPLVAGAGFTGSIRGGRALFDAAAARPVPIPFHGELGSLNPVVVTEAAATERGEEIGGGLAGSMTLGVGQFCVKPGLVLAPEGAGGDRLVKSLTEAVSDTEAGVLLDHRMRDDFVAGVRARAGLRDVSAPVTPGAGGEHTVSAGFFTVPAARLAGGGEHDLLLEECFGPVTVVARYRDDAEITAVLSRLPGNLTATVQLSSDEAAGVSPRGAALIAEVTPLAGRVLVDGWPTGVAVAPAQHHGGPYPATTSTSTSVGGTAIERWLRPVAYQSTPEPLLPPELRDANPLGLPRRVDGRLEH